jgi:DNA-binding response OmpR family regulator
MLAKPFTKEQLRALIQALLYRDAGVVPLRPKRAEHGIR